MQHIFSSYKTTTLIAIIEDDDNDCFMYVDAIEELRTRSKDGDLTAFQFLLQCDFNQPLEAQGN
jgi:hypothetical protein